MRRDGLHDNRCALPGGNEAQTRYELMERNLVRLNKYKRARAALLEQILGNQHHPRPAATLDGKREGSRKHATRKKEAESQRKKALFGFVKILSSLLGALPVNETNRDCPA